YHLLCLLIRQLPRLSNSTIFPYTTLFRSLLLPEPGQHLTEHLPSRFAVLLRTELEIDAELGEEPVPGPFDGGPRIDQGAVHVQQQRRSTQRQRVLARGGGFRRCGHGPRFSHRMPDGSAASSLVTVECRAS